MKTLEKTSTSSIKPLDIQVFVFPEKKAKKTKNFSGKLKGIFGDAVEYQRNLRKEW